MEQLVLDIHSENDANLIKELLKKFKHIDVQSFSSSISAKSVKDKINQGIKDADEGRVTPLKKAKAQIAKRIFDHGR